MANFSPTVVEASDGKWNVVDSATNGKFLAGPYASLQAATDASVAIATLDTGGEKVSSPSFDSQMQSVKTASQESQDVEEARAATKSETGVALGGAAGVCSRGDDWTPPGPNKTQSAVNAAFNSLVKPQPNILSDYASYTYQMSWYLLTPQQYTSLVGLGAKNASTWQLLMQSGGANSGNAPSEGSAGYGSFMNSLLGSNSSAQGNMTGIRNKYFNLDYYMDDFEIETLVPLKGTGAAHAATSISFTVTEPMGVTLLENLYRAVQDVYKSENGGKSTNYSMAMYCLGIRFYGYDNQGNLVKVGRSGSQSGNTNFSDPKAVVEKYIPFVLKNISFRLTNNAVKYKVECAPQGQTFNIGTDRGTIPFPIELTGATTKDILVSGGKGTAGGDAKTGNVKTEGRQTKAVVAEPPKKSLIGTKMNTTWNPGTATADAVGAEYGP